MINNPKVQAALAAVAASAQPVQATWSGQIDLSKCVASARLVDPDLFKPTIFYTSGFPEIDDALGGGLAAGETTTMFAPAALGKTTMVANMALRIAQAGVPCAIISLEMTNIDIWRLLCGIDAKVERRNVRCNTMTTTESQNFATSITKLSRFPLYVVDRLAFPRNTNFTAPDMKIVENVINDGVHRCGWKVVFIDYLAKVGPHDDDDLIRIPRLTNWAFGLAQHQKIHLVALAQANKAAYGRVDQKTRIRSLSLMDVKSGVETVADFDNVIGLVRDDWDTGMLTNLVELRAIMLKVRQGPGGTVHLHFQKPTGRIFEQTPYTTGQPSTVPPRLAQPQAATQSVSAAAPI